MKKLRTAAIAALKELRRLRRVHLPTYEGKIGEPDLAVIRKLRKAISLSASRSWE